MIMVRAGKWPAAQLPEALTAQPGGLHVVIDRNLVSAEPFGRNYLVSVSVNPSVHVPTETYAETKRKTRKNTLCANLCV